MHKYMLESLRTLSVVSIMFQLVFATGSLVEEDLLNLRSVYLLLAAFISAHLPLTQRLAMTASVAHL